MTGIQLILMFSIAIVLAGLSLLTFGREQGSGTIKVFGIEMTGSTPLRAIALGSGLFLYAILQNSVSTCIVFCSPTVVSTPATGDTPPAPLEMPATKVSAFAIMAYNSAGLPAAGMQLARRDWKRIKADLWMETYPGGIASYFDVIGRITLAGCPGTVVKNEVDQNHRAFIPDKGCEVICEAIPQFLLSSLI